MFTFCATAAPTCHPSGEAHSLPATAPLVMMFATNPFPVNRASEAASRRLAAHPIGTRRPLSPFLSPSATPQLQPAQPLSTRVAKNAVGDTRRHATPRPAGVGSLLPLGNLFGVEHRQWQKAPDPLNLSTTLAPAQSRAPDAWRTRSWSGQSTFGLLDLDLRVRKSKSRPRFSSQFHHSTSRNKGSNAPRPTRRGKTFGPL